MKACGIIVEYNPFHLGHLYHLNKAKQITNCDVLIAVMSPNFVQRGEPAIEAKEKRVKEALNNGINLVVELPFICAVESADIFAKYAINILNSLLCKWVVFGSETGNIKQFMDKYNANEFNVPRLDEEIQKYLIKGIGYPKARSLALKDIHEYYLETPNDILGNSYINTIITQKLAIQPLSIKRLKKFKSAHQIREKMIKGADCSALLNASHPRNELHYLEQYFDLLKYRLLSCSLEELANIHLINEGIEYLFIKNIKSCTSMQQFIHKCTSKRYSGARIKRTITHILCNTNAKEAEEILARPLPYIRVLGMDQKGREYLHSIRKNATTPIHTRFEGRDDKIAQMELKASNVYYAVCQEPKRTECLEYELYHFPIFK